MYFPSSRIIRKQGANAGVQTEIACYKADGATLDDFREAVTTLEDLTRTARRVLGSEHPLTMETEEDLREVQTALRAREAPSPGSA